MPLPLRRLLVASAVVCVIGSACSRPDDLASVNLAIRMGVMNSDGLDGPFRLEIDWIDLCPV